MADERPLWERHPWDTKASFDRFHRFYLAQDAPRSLNEAYRRYRAEKGPQQGRNEAAPKRSLRAPGGWVRWFRGQDSKGQPKPGAKTWAERAAAYDEHLAEQDRQKWEARRRQVREQDWGAGEELRDLAANILAQSPQFLKTTRRLIKGHGGAPDREVVTIALDGSFLLRAVKLASDLQRQAAEVLPPTQRLEHTGQDGGPIQTRTTEVVLYVPDNERGDDDRDES